MEHDSSVHIYLQLQLKFTRSYGLTVPIGGSDGKAIHLVATNNISDLSAYSIRVANNGSGTFSSRVYI